MEIASLKLLLGIPEAWKKDVLAVLGVVLKSRVLS